MACELGIHAAFVALEKGGGHVITWFFVLFFWGVLFCFGCVFCIGQWFLVFEVEGE